MRGAFETTAVGWLTLVLGWVLTDLALLSVVVYLWSKRVNKTSFYHLDDLLLYLSFLLSIALMSVTTWAVVVEGQGRHQSGQSHSQFELVAKSLLINEILWGIVNTFLRIGAVLFIRKIFVHQFYWTWINTVTIVLLVVSVAYAIAVIATSLAICQPISAGWDPAVMGRCGNEIAVYLGLEVISAILDLAIVITPLPRLMRLRVPLSTRWQTCVLFSLGSVVFIITGLRIAALNRVNSHDFSYDRGYIGLLSILGPLIAIICCCTTACAGTVLKQFRLWAEHGKPAPLKVLWNISTRRSRWRSSTATRKNEEAELGGVVSKPEALESVSTLEL